MLRHGILGLINNGDKTGYEIMKVFRDSLNHFWSAQTSQIYRELRTMEQAGWISQKHEEQQGKPDKNVFSITSAGRDELLRWLRDDGLPTGFKNPFLMKVFFMGELPVEESIAFFEDFLKDTVFPDGGAEASANADLYRQAMAHPEKVLYWKLTIEFGRRYEAMQREWCAYCIHELEKLRRLQDGGAQVGNASTNEREERR